MRSVYVKAPFHFEFREESVPKPGVGEILVAVAYCGICGSDMHLARREAKTFTPIGHEVSGVVRVVGPGVTHVREGDPVALDCGNSCGVCPECRAGHPRRCTDLRGFYGTQSGLAEFLLANAQNAHPVGDLDLKTASLLEPFGVAMNMVMSLDIGLMDDVLLIGPGPIGLLALAACRAQGARSLAAVGRSDGARGAIAREIGAQTFFLPAQPEAFDDAGLKERFDKIIVTAPPAALPAALMAAKTEAVIAYCGLGHANASVALDWDVVHARSVTIKPMGDTPRYMPQAVELLRRDSVLAGKLITHVFGGDDIEKAFHFLEKKRDEVVKAVVRVGR